jgi:cytosine/adenosine deaminase-related metal-dependent hydrolase
MDYEKLYKEALSRARQFSEHPLQEDSDSIVEYIFPELKELGDEEEVRKAMIDFFKHEREEGVTVLHYGVNIERMIAWLEKQGEKKSAWSEEDKRKIDRIYSILSQAADTHAFSTSCRLIGDKECIELQDFLKSLRHQNR